MIIRKMISCLRNPFLQAPGVWALTIILPLSLFGQKHFDFNGNCQQAYREIIQLKLESGERILSAEKKKDPANLIPSFLEGYIDFFTLFFTEDPSIYRDRKDKLDKRLQLMAEGPESSPFSLFTRSVLHFQRAAVRIKFGEHWDAAWDFRRSFLQSREDQKKFPAFAPAVMLGGAMQVVAGTIPDGYKWLSGLLGIEGNIKEGMEHLSGFLALDDPWAALYRDEACFYYLYLKFYVENQREDVFSYIRAHGLDIRNNHLYAYLAVNLAINSQQSAYAERVIREKNNSAEYLAMPSWDQEMGYAALYHLDPEAHVYLERFLQTFKGKFYVKDVLLKLSWCYYLQGDEQKAAAYRAQVLQKGATDADADKQAEKEARGGKWPDKSLLRARLLSDGGYYGEALQSLKGMSTGDLSTPEGKCELAYRLGRIYDGLGRKDEAISAYLTALKTGEHLKEYFAARAALQTGYIYESRGDKARAISYFQKCLSLKGHEYQNSLDQRAKAGIGRCKGE
jgi:tetratricopeptide (TPR) repeat protein